MIITQLTIVLIAYLIFVISNIVEVIVYDDKYIDVSFLILMTIIRQRLWIIFNSFILQHLWQLLAWMLSKHWRLLNSWKFLQIRSRDRILPKIRCTTNFKTSLSMMKLILRRTLTRVIKRPRVLISRAMNSSKQIMTPKFYRDRPHSHLKQVSTQ